MDVIDTPDQVTPEWLAAALASAGIDGRVDAVEVRPIGTGQMSGTFAVTVTGIGVPERLVLKLASENEATRVGGKVGYRAEVGFYADLASSLRIRVPRCYLAVAADEFTRFTLLLEDVSPAAQGDQIAGASAEVITTAAVNLAGLHASTWCDDRLWSRPWAVAYDEARVRHLSDLYVRSSTVFAAHFAGRLDAAWLDTLQSLGGEISAFLASSNGRFSAIHGDYRLDNLLIGADDEVIAVDWQTLAVGRPGRDLAYLITTSLSVDDRRTSESAIIAAYHAALCAGGVSDCSLDDCLNEYVFGLLHAVFIIVVGAAMSDATDRGDRMFIAMTERVMAAIEDHCRLRR